MIRRGTWILLVVLAGLVGFSLYWKDRSAKLAALATPTPGSTPLFEASLGSPTDVTIESGIGTAVEISRDDDSGKWVLKQPKATDANQGSAEAAATQVGALNVLSSVDLGSDVVGLDKPAYTITVTFNKSGTHSLKVGAATPIQTGYYAQLDGGAVQVVDKDGMDALLDLLNHPPYLATDTPVPTATASPMPATPTQEPNATDTERPAPAAPTATP